MPVSPWPILFPVLLIAVPLLYLPFGIQRFVRARNRSLIILACLFAWIYVPGAMYYCRAALGDSAGMYELARWTEQHDDRLGECILWPIEPDTLGGYAWLEKSASRSYPPAVYALGVRLKLGVFVPEPPGWTGPAGNCFPQPERGQPLIDQAIGLGYQPTIPEEQFYFGVYRQ